MRWCAGRRMARGRRDHHQRNYSCLHTSRSESHGATGELIEKDASWKTLPIMPPTSRVVGKEQRPVPDVIRWLILGLRGVHDLSNRGQKGPWLWATHPQERTPAALPISKYEIAALAIFHRNE